MNGRRKIETDQKLTTKMIVKEITDEERMRGETKDQRRRR